MKFRTSRWGLAALVVAAAVLRAQHLRWGFPDVFEEATPVRQAIAFWGVPGSGLDLNPHFFKYPSFTFYLNFFLQVVWYFWLSLKGSVGSLNEFRQVLSQNLPHAVLLGRWLQVVLGSVTVIPAYLLGRRLAGRTAGWGAAVLVAVLPTLVTESRLVGPDAALALFAACALVAASRLAARGERADYLWCGLWIGLATASKYPGALLLAALLTAHAVQGGRRGPAGILLSSRFWQALVTAGVVFVLASPYVLLDFRSAAADLRFERLHMAFGHLGRENGRAWLYYLTRVIPHGWTPVVAGLAAAGVVGLLLRGRRREALPGAVFVVVWILVVGSWRMAAPRYLLPLAPLGAAWAGVALAAVPARLPRPRAAAALWVLLVAGAAAWPAVLSRGLVSREARTDSRLAAQDWIQNHVPIHASLLVERYGPEPDPKDYLVLYLPFHGVTPHIYDGAYVPDLYSTFDYVVFSSGVYSRYLAHPRDYPQEVAFYGSMIRRFHEVAYFPQGEYQGPEIRILERRKDVDAGGVMDLPAAYYLEYKDNGPLAEYLSALGTLLVRQGQTTPGFHLLQQAVDMDKKNAKVWGNLGAMRLSEGQIERALTAFRRARDLDPKDPEVRYNLGMVYSRMGESGQAADAFRAAVGLKPEMETAYLGLAKALVEDDRFGEARLVLNEFLIRFPRSPLHRRAQEALAQLAHLGPGKP